MDTKELRQALNEMGADTAASMIDALKDGALLARLQPSGMTEKEFQIVVEDLCEEIRSASSLGRKGGAVKSPRKIAASRGNGKRGGRPRVVAANIGGEIVDTYRVERRAGESEKEFKQRVLNCAVAEFFGWYKLIKA